MAAWTKLQRENQGWGQLERETLGTREAVLYGVGLQALCCHLGGRPPWLLQLLTCCCHSPLSVYYIAMAWLHLSVGHQAQPSSCSTGFGLHPVVLVHTCDCCFPLSWLGLLSRTTQSLKLELGCMGLGFKAVRTWVSAHAHPRTAAGTRCGCPAQATVFQPTELVLLV